MRITKKKFVVDTPNAEIMRICSVTDILLNYNGYLNLINNKTIIDLRFENVEKY